MIQTCHTPISVLTGLNRLPKHERTSLHRLNQQNRLIRAFSARYHHPTQPLLQAGPVASQFVVAGAAVLVAASVLRAAGAAFALRVPPQQWLPKLLVHVVLQPERGQGHCPLLPPPAEGSTNSTYYSIRTKVALHSIQSQHENRTNRFRRRKHQDRSLALTAPVAQQKPISDSSVAVLGMSSPSSCWKAIIRTRCC